MNTPLDAHRHPTGMKLRAIAAMLAFATTPSHGLWLGEPLVRSRLGEPLRVDIPYRLEEGETIDDRCLGLGGAGAASADGLEFLARGRTRLVEYGLERAILITTQQPQSEPVVKARLQVDCGVKVNLSRDYVWLLDPPVADDVADRSNVPPLPPLAVETAAAALPAHGESVKVRDEAQASPEGKPAPSAPTTRRHLVTPGETLADIAREMAPDDTESQDRYVRAIIALNPELFSSRPANDVPAGTELVLPVPSTPSATAPAGDAPTVVASAPRALDAAPGGHKHAKRGGKNRPATHLASKRHGPARDTPRDTASALASDAVAADAERAHAETKQALADTARIAADGTVDATRAPGQSGGGETRREGSYRFSLTLSNVDPTAAAHPLTPAQKRSRDEANDDDRQATVLALRDQIKSLQGEISRLQQELGRPARLDGSVPGPVPSAPVAPAPATVPAVRVDTERTPSPAEPPKATTQLPHPPKHAPLAAPKPHRDWTDAVWSVFANFGLPLGAAGTLGLALLFWRRRKAGQDNVYIEPVASVPTLTAETIAPAAQEPVAVRKPVPPQGDPVPLTESALEFIPPPPPAQDDATRDQRRAYIAERFPEVAAGVIELHDVDAIVEASRQYFEGDGDTDKAVELLEFSIADDPTQLKLWLAEFEILRRSDRGPAFDKLATRYRLQFGENEHWRTVCSVGLELDPENRTFQAGAVAPEAPADEWAAHGVEAVDTTEPERHENWLNAPLDFTPELLANDLRDSLLADFQEEENSRPTKDTKVLSLASRDEDQAVNG